MSGANLVVLSDGEHPVDYAAVEVDNGQTVSALVPRHHADLSGSACFNDTRVEVAAYQPAPKLGEVGIRRIS